MNEEWKPILNYPGYEVSSIGKVRSLPRISICKDPQGKDRTYRVRGCMLQLRMSFGYMQTCMRIPGRKAKSDFIHRLVAIAFIPNPENKPQVNHIDHDRTNNHVSNLEWVTQSENAKHAGKSGRLTFNNNKLTLEQVREIRNSPDVTCLAMGKKFGVTKGIVSKIRRRELWKSW